MPQKISALFVCSSPNVWDFFKKALSECPWSVSSKKWSFANCLAIFFVSCESFVRGNLRELRFFFHKIRILVVPLLKTLYSADERNNHHTYMSLIILLILSEDEFFNGMYLVFLHFVIRPTKCNECFPENR